MRDLYQWLKDEDERKRNGNSFHLSIFVAMNSGVIIGLGSNLGNRREHLNDAIELIRSRVGSVVQESSIYETPPLGFEALQQFYNMVIEVETLLSARELLEELLLIERKMGRERSSGDGYSSRSIDLDLLFYGDQVINEPHLLIPHPGIPKRRFVLIPLLEIAPEMIHPVLQRSITQLNKDCTDTSAIRKVE